MWKWLPPRLNDRERAVAWVKRLPRLWSSSDYRCVHIYFELSKGGVALSTMLFVYALAGFAEMHVFLLAVSFFIWIVFMFLSLRMGRYLGLFVENGAVESCLEKDQKELRRFLPKRSKLDRSDYEQLSDRALGHFFVFSMTIAALFSWLNFFDQRIEPLTFIVFFWICMWSGCRMRKRFALLDCFVNEEELTE